MPLASWLLAFGLVALGAEHRVAATPTKYSFSLKGGRATSATCPGGDFQIKVGRGRIVDSTLNLTEVAWSGPECRGVFLGSASIVRTQAGTLLTGSDLFGAAQLDDVKMVFASTDNGETWTLRANVSKMYWANFFTVEKSLYLMGTYGDDIHKISPPNKIPLKGGPVVVARSDDDGVTWTEATTVLPGSFQTAPTPVVEVNGTLYRTMEDSSVGVGAFVMWARSDANLLLPASWSRSTSINAPKGPGGESLNWQEGSAIVGPDGQVYNLLRVNDQTSMFHNVAGLTRLVGNNLVFETYVSGPFGTSKFVVRQHNGSGAYYALSTDVTPEAAAAGLIGARNHLVLATSADLRVWRTCTTVLEDDTGFVANDSVKYTGFEYPDWIFDGSDIIVAVRTAYRGAVSSGSSNRLTTKRVEGFASLCSTGLSQVYDDVV